MKHLIILWTWQISAAWNELYRQHPLVCTIVIAFALFFLLAIVVNPFIPPNRLDEDIEQAEADAIIRKISAQKGEVEAWLNRKVSTSSSADDSFVIEKIVVDDTTVQLMSDTYRCQIYFTLPFEEEGSVVSAFGEKVNSVLSPRQIEKQARKEFQAALALSQPLESVSGLPWMLEPETSSKIIRFTVGSA